jgi:asparagine synthase (glutamine-hydrolysing)
MCGILVVLSGKQVNQDLFDFSDLENRGPDNRTDVVTEKCFLSFHRLSINDTSSVGNQPMSLNGASMVCNGEIYNHKELEAQYGLSPVSGSDCEVIILLYDLFKKKLTPEEAFVKMVKKIYGVFAIVIVDGEKCFVARDRIGVRPLFRGELPDKTVAISSTPQALAKSCENIQPFLPGNSYVVYSNGNFSTLYTDSVILPEIREANYEDKIRNTLENAVKIRLMSDRPMGCLLSGGLDSSIVTAILVKFLGAKNVRTYSIGMKGSIDLFYARKVAEYLGTDHHEVIFTPEEGFAVIPEVIKTLASYDITTIRASVGMYLVSKYISQQSKDKVIFSGEGSDEIFQGYLYFHKAPSPEAGEQESLRLIEDLHLYDVLRADRCISSNGLEPRVPFLDRKVVDIAMALPTNAKCPRNGVEKYYLRKAFSGYLPDEIIWRRKDGFSDGVSSLQKSWYVYIQEFVDKLIPDHLMNPTFPSKEAFYYKLCFDHYFPKYDLSLPYWMPRWTGGKDPSGRLVTV